MKRASPSKVQPPAKRPRGSPQDQPPPAPATPASGLYSGVALLDRGGPRGVLVAHPTAFCILRPWGRDLGGPHRVFLHTFTGRSSPSVAIGGGVCIPFGGFAYTRGQLDEISGVLSACRISRASPLWEDSVVRMMSFARFPVEAAGRLFLWRGGSQPPDYIPPRPTALPHPCRTPPSEDGPGSRHAMLEELLGLHDSLVDCASLSSMRELGPGDTVFWAQPSDDEAFPAGLYAARVLVRVSNSRHEVFGPRHSHAEREP